MTGHTQTADPAGLGATADDSRYHDYHEAVQAHERRLLRLIAGDAPLDQVLGELCHSLEQLSGRALRTAFLLVDRAAGRFRCAAAPSLPDAYASAVSALSLDDPTVPCVRAIATQAPVIVADIAAEAADRPIAQAAQALGFVAVWSFPVVVQDEAVAALALFPAQPATPDERETHLIGFATELARIALAHAERERELREALESLRTRERDYRRLFRANPQPMYIFDTATLEMLEANDAACAQYGYGRAEFLALTAEDVRPAEEVPRFLENLRTSEGRFVPDAGIWYHRRQDGAVFPIRATYGPIRYAERDARIVLARDVTEQLRVEERVREFNATLEERVAARTAALEAANRELDAFNFSVSHDLRTPLRAIDGFSQALLEEEAARLSESGRDYLRRMRAAAKRMADLIDAMYHLSRLSRQSMQVRELDLSATAQAVVEELRQGEPGRRVEAVIAPQIRAEGDPGLMHIVVANLLGNGWKYTGRTEGARIEFGTITDADSRGNTVYFVRDNGAGFDMQFSDKLFKLFHRLHRDDEFAGHGVGLATVQRVVRRHGGRVWAEAAKNRGATFFFTLWENEALRREAEEGAYESA
ncbi:MAG: PAS domain S-box protein [Rhodocyclales bacterium]|nr:PAS domain S-box protein [Rhodocyclales bacterium]